MGIENAPIFIALAGVIGLLIGMLIAYLFIAREAKTPIETTPPPAMTQEGFSNVANVWYSPAGKKIVTEMDGEFYRDFLVLSPDQKKKVLRTITLWSEWCGKTAPVVVEKPLEETQIGVAKEPATTLSDEVTIAVDRKAPLPPISPFVETEPAKPEPVAAKTIAGQISDIIAEMIEESPLKEKGIKLIENQQHGVDVWVGLEKFDGIDSIPYPEVQQLIRAAVSRWEREASSYINPKS